MSTDNAQERGFYRKGKIVFVTAAAYTMTPRDLVLLVDSSSAAVVITLPPVALVPGRIYSIRKVGTGTNKVEVVDATALDMTIIAAVDMDVTLDRILLHSDGTVWTLLSQAAAYAH